MRMNLQLLPTNLGKIHLKRPKRHAVAAFREDNPYLTDAEERAQEWARYARQRKADTERLEKILPLKVVKDEQKEQLLDVYVAAYGGVDKGLIAKIPAE